MTGELLYLAISAGFVVLLWLFVFAVVWAIRSDLFGPKVKRLRTAGAAAPSVRPSPPPVPPTGRDAASASRSASGATHLVFTDGPARGRQLTLTQDVLTFGRSADSSVVLRDDYTSSHHARLSRRGSQWYIEDLGSTNGTFVGGQRISSSTPVGTGVVISVGSTTMELRG